MGKSRLQVPICASEHLYLALCRCFPNILVQMSGVGVGRKEEGSF